MNDFEYFKAAFQRANLNIKIEFVNNLKSEEKEINIANDLVILKFDRHGQLKKLDLTSY